MLPQLAPRAGVVVQSERKERQLQIEHATEHLMFRTDLECAVWNSLSEYARRQDTDLPAGVRHKLLRCNVWYQGFEEIWSDTSTYPEVEIEVPAVILGLEKKGKILLGAGTEKIYVVKIWHEYSFDGPQLSATVVRRLHFYKEEE